jgi:hypothetical protein
MTFLATFAFDLLFRAKHLFVAADPLILACCGSNPQWRFTHVPLGEYRDSVTAAWLQRLGVVAGWPDLQFAGPDRQMVFLELKRRGGRLSEAQAAIRARLRDCGFAYLATSDIDLAIEWLKQHGVLRGGFTVQ